MDFETAESAKEAGWSSFNSGKVEISEDGGVDDSRCVRYYDASRDGIRYQYSCPTTNLYKNMTKAVQNPLAQMPHHTLSLL